jgi:hypothetical protein
MLQHIKADVFCHWSENPPVYRIYVNGDMLTERTFGWPGYQVFIRENIICNLEVGIHVIRIENCSPSGSFELKNLMIEGGPAAIHPNYTPTSTEITFLVEQ